MDPSTAGIRASEPSLEKQTHVLCLSWLCQSGASSERASELGNTNNGEWGIQDAHGNPLRGLISGKQPRQSMENSCVWLQDHASVLTSDEFTPKPLPSPVTLLQHLGPKGNSESPAVLGLWAEPVLGLSPALLGHMADVSLDHQWDILVPGHPTGWAFQSLAKMPRVSHCSFTSGCPPSSPLWPGQNLTF